MERETFEPIVWCTKCNWGKFDGGDRVEHVLNESFVSQYTAEKGTKPTVSYLANKCLYHFSNGRNCPHNCCGRAIFCTYCAKFGIIHAYGKCWHAAAKNNVQWKDAEVVFQYQSQIDEVRKSIDIDMGESFAIREVTKDYIYYCNGTHTTLVLIPIPVDKDLQGVESLRNLYNVLPPVKPSTIPLMTFDPVAGPVQEEVNPETWLAELYNKYNIVT